MTSLLSLATYERGFRRVGVDVLGVASLTLHFAGPPPTSAPAWRFRI
jgi:hypothetical protein